MTLLKHNTAHTTNSKAKQGYAAKSQQHSHLYLKALLFAGNGKVFCQVSLFLHVATGPKPCVG